MSKLKGTPIPIEPVEDSGWVSDKASSIPRRGLRDYERRFNFGRDLTVVEIDQMCAWLQANECPGWTPVRMSKFGPNEYKARTCWDSSD